MTLSPSSKDVFLCLANAFWSTGLSGGDVRFIEMAKKFPLLNLKVWTITSRQGKTIFSQNNLQCQQYIVSPHWFDYLGIYVSYLFRTLFSLFWFATKGKRYVRLFYSISDFFPDVILPFLFTTKERPWIQVIHHLYPSPFQRKGSFFRNTIGYLSQHFSLWCIKKKATKVIVVNSLLAEELQQMGFSPEKIAISSNGISTQEFEIHHLSAPSYEALTLARISPNKGIMDLPFIWQEVIKEFPQVKLAIIGGKPEGSLAQFYEDVQKTIQKTLPPESIHLLGFLPREKVIVLLKQAKVFVFPSYEEGWGIAIAEAMAAGLPVVAWNLKIYSHVFQDKVIQVPLGNYKEMAEKIIYLLKHENERKKLGQENKNWIQRYAWNEVASQEVHLIQQVLEETHGSPC